MTNLRIIVAITGASGVVYGVRLLEELNRRDVEVHLIVSENGEKILKLEMNIDVRELGKLAYKVYDPHDLTAPLASGSFISNGMVIVPCSVKTMAKIASGICDDLITRAAHCTLKEGRKLILVIREMPLRVIDIMNMLLLKLEGAIVMPASPAFYHKPQNIDDLINYVVGKVLDALGIEHNLYKRWGDGYYREDRQASARGLKV